MRSRICAALLCCFVASCATVAATPPPDALLGYVRCAHSALVSWEAEAGRRIDASCSVQPESCQTLRAEMSRLVAAAQGYVDKAYEAIEKRDDAAAKAALAITAVAATGAPLASCVEGVAP